MEPQRPNPALFLNMKAAEASDYDPVIVPTGNSWNDFGYQIQVLVGLRVSLNHVEWLHARMAIFDVKKIDLFFAERLAEKPDGLPLRELGVAFATLLSEAKNYGMVRNLIGVERGYDLLLSLNDIALLQDLGQDVPDWDEFFASAVFNYAMIRSSQGHFAMRNGANELLGRDSFSTDACEQFAATLKNGGPPFAFDFKFNRANRFRGRIAVLVGKNGCGKTTALAKLARALADRNSRQASLKPRPQVNQVLAFAHSQSLSLFVPRSSSRSAARIRTFSLDSAGSRSRKQTSNTMLFAEICRSHDESGIRTLSYLSEILDAEFSDLRLWGPIKASGPDGQPSFAPLSHWMEAYGEQRRIQALSDIDHTRDLVFYADGNVERKLSLGQTAFLHFILFALANAGPSSVFAVDEPENFLHPNLISRFMRVLNQILLSTRSIAIVATHSPFVVREVQSAQIHVLRTDEDGKFVVAGPLLQTLGANVSVVSNEVFGDDLHHHLFLEVVDRATNDGITFHQALDQYAGELSSDALMLMRQRIEREE